MPAFSVAASALGKSSMPLPDMNAFSPIAPHSRSDSIGRPDLPGTSPPHNAKSTCDFLLRHRALRRERLARRITGGVELSGMSK